MRSCQLGLDTFDGNPQRVPNGGMTHLVLPAESHHYALPLGQRMNRAAARFGEVR